MIVAAVALLSLALAPKNGPTTVPTRPLPQPTASPGHPGAAITPATLRNNPLFNVISDVTLSTPVTGMLYADGALYAWSSVGNQVAGVVSRIDLATARVTATAPLQGIAGAFAGGLLWLTATSQNAADGALRVVALDPTSLAVVHNLAVPAMRPDGGIDHGSIAAAGGLIWVAATSGLYGINPSTASIVRRTPTPSPPPENGYHFGPGDYQIDIAAPSDGTALWTAETPGGGGYAALQVRDPRTGAVTYASNNSLLSAGGVQIAAADPYAWIATTGGHCGSYLQIEDKTGLPPFPPQAGLVTCSSQLALAGNTLWAYDLQTHRIACTGATTGAVLAKSNLPVDDITALPDSQIAMSSYNNASSTATVAIAVPEAHCSP